jgi:hypothetical protein
MVQTFLDSVKGRRPFRVRHRDHPDHPDLAVITGPLDDVVVMYAGKVIEHAPIRWLFAEPQHPYWNMRRKYPELFDSYSFNPEAYNRFPIDELVMSRPKSARDGAFTPRCPASHNGAGRCWAPSHQPMFFDHKQRRVGLVSCRQGSLDVCHTVEPGLSHQTDRECQMRHAAVRCRSLVEHAIACQAP